MPIIAIVGLKGGTGKSFSTIALAGEFVRRERRVMILDGDPSGAASRWVEASDHPVPVDPLCGVLLRPDCLFEHVDRQYRTALVDTAPNDREQQWAALMAADVALLPTTPGALADGGLRSTIALIEEAKQLRPWLTIGAFVTRAPRKRSDTLIDPGRDVPPEWRLEAALSERPQYERAIAEGRTVFDISRRSTAARELVRLADIVEAMLPQRIERRPLDLSDASIFDLPEERTTSTSIDHALVSDAWAEPTVLWDEKTNAGEA